MWAKRDWKEIEIGIAPTPGSSSERLLENDKKNEEEEEKTERVLFEEESEQFGLQKAPLLLPFSTSWSYQTNP